MEMTFNISDESKSKLNAAIKAYQNGDESSFGDVFSLTNDEFMKRAERWFGDDSIGQDAVQLVYIKLADEVKDEQEKFADIDSFLKRAAELLEETCEQLKKKQQIEVPEDLDAIVGIGKDIVTAKEVKEYSQKKKDELEKRKEQEIMNLH